MASAAARAAFVDTLIIVSSLRLLRTQLMSSTAVAQSMAAPPPCIERLAGLSRE
jgi:hypothetical protein